jgi:hypothetical protein
VQINELEYYGYEEGDTSVDVVHRSIPNKPGTQQNIVLWDPNDPASFSLADSSNVYDLSGTGNTGIFGPANNAAKPTLYSSPEGWNAWSFSGNNDCTIETEYGSAVGVTGIHSLSLWFWRDPVNNIGAQRTLASIDSDLTGAQDQTPHFTVDASGKIGYKFWSNDLTGQIETPKGQWVHVAFTYDGGTLKESRKIYINTVLDDLGTGTVNALNLPANSRFILGGYQDRTQCWDGYIAGVRLYSKVLSREQVLELFDEGAERFGIREDLVSVHKGNLGIGLRDPEQRLVVAGSLQEFPPGAMTSEYTHFTGHGIFKAISSGGEIASTEPLDAFNKDWSSSSYWYSRDNTYGTSATNVTGGRNAYTGSNSLGGYSGEWLGLMFPCGFVCKSVEIAARNGEIISAPHDIVVLGATNPFDETEWETIGTFYGKSSNDFWVDGGVGMPFPINYDKPVYGIALVFTAGNYHYAVTVSEIQFFGVPQMNVTDGRQLNVGQVMTSSVGIGKVPEAQLDVRGSLRCDVVSDFLKIDHPGNQLSISRSDAYKNEFRWYAWSGGCNWFTPYTGNGIYIGRDGETLTEFNFYNVTTVKRGSSVISSSDDRLKRDEAFITNATDTLLKLKPQTYIKKHRLPENENDIDIPEQFEAGLIAQDVWYDAPEIRFLVHPCKDANPSETKPISPDPNDPTQDPDYSSWGTTQAYVNYEGFLPYLIKSNQEIYTELQAEKVRNDTLEARVTALENA